MSLPAELITLHITFRPFPQYFFIEPNALQLSDLSFSLKGKTRIKSWQELHLVFEVRCLIEGRTLHEEGGD